MTSDEREAPPPGDPAVIAQAWGVVEAGEVIARLYPHMDLEPPEACQNAFWLGVVAFMSAYAFCLQADDEDASARVLRERCMARGIEVKEKHLAAIMEAARHESEMRQ